MSADQSFDVVIVGGGMVGASLAHALAGTDWSVAMIEASAEDALEQPAYDERVIALSYGSRQIFAQMGVWQALNKAVTPIKRIHVSDRGHFGFSHLDHEEEGVDALGYVIPAREIGKALQPGLADIANLTVIRPAQVTAVKLDAEHTVSVDISRNGEQLRIAARLLVAADGGRSMVREAAGIALNLHDYGHTAIIANVTPDLHHHNVAYERFTDSGPLALLPMQDKRMSLVWTVHSEEAESVLAMNDATFIAALQDRFGYRVGRFMKVGERLAYPLRLVQAKQQTKARLALIGNAAHTLHPIGGQGFNLGLRDVAALASALAKAQGQDPGATNLLDEYANTRAKDHKTTITATDRLAKLFSNNTPGLVQLRDVGMLALDMIPSARHLLAKFAMGKAAGLPRISASSTDRRI